VEAVDNWSVTKPWKDPGSNIQTSFSVHNTIAIYKEITEEP